MKIIGFIKEVFSPKLKCERIGHKQEKVRFLIYKDSDFYAAESGYADFVVCKRCGLFLSGPENFEYQYSISSLTMPSLDMIKFRKDGYFIRKI